MLYDILVKKGMINRGNWNRLKACMQKAEAGEKLKIGFLGGSITQGSLSSTPKMCYAYLVYDWWKKKFPLAELEFINAGIGGTTSQYGVSRVEEHLLQYQPDFILIEFAVNDEDSEFYEETYEGLIRKTYAASCAPAVMLMNNVRYDDGSSAERIHLAVARHYELPMVSMKNTILPEVMSGKIKRRDITPDDLHPNDAGHELVSGVITTFLENVYRERGTQEEISFKGDGNLPEPITANAYENSIRYQNYNSAPVISGFVPDAEPQNDIREIFKRGWTASHKGDKISFELECTGVAVQYRKSVRKPTPIARVVIDGNEETAILLDGNFQEDWGDCLFIDTVARHMKLSKHTVEITIVETHDGDVVPFYLVSVIGSR